MALLHEKIFYHRRVFSPGKDSYRPENLCTNLVHTLLLNSVNRTRLTRRYKLSIRSLRFKNLHR